VKRRREDKEKKKRTQYRLNKVEWPVAHARTSTLVGGPSSINANVRISNTVDS